MSTNVNAAKSYHAGSESVSYDMPDQVKAMSLRASSSDLKMNVRKQCSMQWELDVRPLISSSKWLNNYGLKKNRLTLDQILPSIGFKLQDGFDESLMVKKPISSRYGHGLYSQLMKPNGKTFNITGSKHQLQEIQKRLMQAATLYKRRLEWLSTESRRVFGVIEERVVTIVLDIRNISPQQFDQYRAVLETVLREQVIQLTKFNIIRAAEDSEMYSPECVPVTHDTVENAVHWLWHLDRLAQLSPTATCEAVLHALGDTNNEAVYLFTEGSSIDASRELLKEKVSAEKLNIPVHVVSYNCSSSDTIRYLRNFADIMKGRFHAYAVVKEMDAYEAQSMDQLSSKANIVLKKKTYGGLPTGVGVREDVILVFEELEEARNILDQITALLQTVPETKIFTKTKSKEMYQSSGELSEHFMGSAEWIKKFGLQTQKLGLYDILSTVAFKHQDGIVEIMEKPPDETQTDAISRTKLVNARYCDQFPVVRWQDGSVVHVHVTPEVHRHYEERMDVALQKIQQRIDWLRQGSRELFGTVLEDHVYILLDCSASMESSMQFVKDRLFLLMQEQLRHKKKFNLVSFSSKCCCWRDRLVEVSERNLQSAWAWVQSLTCWGSTNTYAAITQALNDPQTQAMYLLTDGRPDQPPKSILAQVQMKQQVPIHTISFNCNDTEANRFLYELARTTHGRYHYFSEEGIDTEQPESWESEDVQLLKQEQKHGLANLEQLASLRDECSSMAWRRQTNDLKRRSRDHPLPDGERTKPVSEMESQDMHRPSLPVPRSKSASPQVHHSPIHPSRALRSSSPLGHSISRRPLTFSQAKKNPLVASHTRTSLLRTLNSCGRFSDSEWLLPETKQLFERQVERQQVLQKVARKNENLRKKRERKFSRLNDVSSKLWLKKNSLTARKLTILDALSPTFVPHRSKYIPILNKHVVAKVFDQIIPLAHVSSHSKQEIRLVSPNAVDLDKYQREVQRCIDQYHERLDQIVWDALPEAVREEYNNEGPVSFWANRSHLMDALEQTNWQDVKEEDITLLCKEIEKGESFLLQAQDLKTAEKNSLPNDEALVINQKNLSVEQDKKGQKLQMNKYTSVNSGKECFHPRDGQLSGAEAFLCLDVLTLDEDQRKTNIVDQDEYVRNTLTSNSSP